MVLQRDAADNKAASVILGSWLSRSIVDVGDAAGVGEGVDFVAAEAVFIVVPEFHTSFPFFLMHVYVFLFAVALELSFVHGAPAETF